MAGRLTDAASGRGFPLGQVAKIGRSSSCDIHLDDSRVSRQHAMVRAEDGAFWLYDLGSFNGSTVNGRRITTACRLHQGDEVGIAGFRLRFTSDGPHLTTLAGAGGDSMQTIGFVRTVNAAVLVSDIKGFTKVSESLPPEEVARKVGRWYASCDEVVNAGGGEIDKFIGDALLAHWFEPGERGLRAALEAAGGLTSPAPAGEPLATAGGSGETSLACCAALHLGEVAYGGMGGGEQTLLGDAVNTTFRIQELTRTLDRPVLVSGEFVRALVGAAAPTGFEPLGEHRVKGRSSPVEVFAPIPATPRGGDT